MEKNDFGLRIFWSYLLVLAVVPVDLFLNPWLYQVADTWQWYNYFSSGHSLTMLYIKHGWQVLAPALLVSGALVSWVVKPRDRY